MNDIKIAIIGLGYVGLPLARLFATKYPVVGFDINQKRIKELQEGNDSTLEISASLLKDVLLDSVSTKEKGLFCTHDVNDIENCNVYIITVPTPVDKNNRPDLTLLFRASEMVGKVIKKNDVIIYESTVYPGATEDDCVPIIAKESGLKFNIDFYVGYSPERINPGDKEHTIDKIKKVTSGSTIEIGKQIDKLYASVITAGTYLASSIKVAEAAKVIENSQRDINIAFINELKKIFDIMGINTNDVLDAASTKWNFLAFKPGLVGGHCIGVDPYYLAQKIQEYGYHPEIILAGRRLNDSMGDYIATQVIKMMIKNDVLVKKANVLIFGFTFKENCSDTRNTKVIDVVNSLNEYGVNVTVYDPRANKEDVKHEYGLDITTIQPDKRFDAALMAVTHKEFEQLDLTKFSSLVYKFK